MNKKIEYINKVSKVKKHNLGIASDLYNYIEEAYELSNAIESNTELVKETARQFVELYTKLEVEANYLKDYNWQEQNEEGKRLQDMLYTALEEVGADALDSELYQDLAKAVDTLDGSNHVVQEMENILSEVKNYIDLN